MDSTPFDIYVVIDIFLFLLIGIGPKIALVPFVELTAGMDAKTKARVLRKMLVTAGTVAILLLVLGGLLARLLHFSTGALSVAGGLILVIIAIGMVRGPTGSGAEQREAADARDPMEMAVFPLAVPYLLNPAGIVVLVTASADAASVGHIAVVLALVALVLGLDVGVFRWANRVSDHLDQSRMLITEKVFGFLLAALAVQLILNGLDAVGVIHLIGH
jgi:multiple antibiotic resistance protein